MDPGGIDLVDLSGGCTTLEDMPRGVGPGVMLNIAGPVSGARRLRRTGA